MNDLTPAQKRAYYLSAITHPVFMPVIGFVVFNEFNIMSFHGQAFLILLGVYTLTVVALPLYFIFSLKRSGYIESYEMHTLKERRLPLLFTSGAMLFNYYLMQRANMLGIYQIYFLSTAAAAIISLAISSYYKISLHTIGIGFLFGLGLVLSSLGQTDMRWYLIMIAIIAGIVGYCRLILNAHNHTQVYLGFVVGAICASGMLFFI